MTVRPEFEHDLGHAGLEDSHAGIEPAHAGIQDPIQISQRFEASSGRLCLALKTGTHFAKNGDGVLDSPLDSSQGRSDGIQRRFDSSQPVAPVVTHQNQRTASPYRLRQRIVFE